MAHAIRMLLFSTLFPSSARPGHGIFVETRLSELLRECPDVQAKVLAPVPWFPFKGAKHGDRGAMARTPQREQRMGLDVLHPRYLVVPKVGMTLAPLGLAAVALAAARGLIAEGFDFDLIDAHYFYPDGVAAAIVARALGKPLVITARGSDINLIAGYTLPRRMMLWAARQASACVGVSQALVDRMRGLGMPAERLHMLRNGVDLQRFRPWPQREARADLGIDGNPLLLSIGNLVPLKGHDLCIDALAELLPTHPRARLVIVGDGPERAHLAARAESRGVAAQVRLVGAVPNADLARWYSAADCLLLASSREGWPNVLLEAMACGTPVIATRVGGIPEVMSGSSLGLLMHSRDVPALTTALVQFLAAPLDRMHVRRYAEGYAWGETSCRQVDLFRSLLAEEGRRA